jgi:hypothetical protein
MRWNISNYWGKKGKAGVGPNPETEIEMRGHVTLVSLSLTTFCLALSFSYHFLFVSVSSLFISHSLFTTQQHKNLLLSFFFIFHSSPLYGFFRYQSIIHHLLLLSNLSFSVHFFTISFFQFQVLEIHFLFC